VKTKIVFSVFKARAETQTVLRRRILKESGELFLDRGFVRVTADDIAGRLGISKATLYKSFPSKEAILRAVVRGILRETGARVEEILGDGEMGFVEKLVVLFSYVGGRISRLGTVMVRDLQKSAPNVWQEVDDFRREKIFKNFKIILECGRKEGLFRGDIDEELLRRIFSFLIEEFVSPEAVLRSGGSPADAFESVIKVFFQGILTDRGRRNFSARTPALFEPRRESVR